jgi:hypothetical protein
MGHSIANIEGKKDEKAGVAKVDFAHIGLLVASILVAPSRRNCEIPGSSWVPCIWGQPLHGKPKKVRPTAEISSPNTRKQL